MITKLRRRWNELRHADRLDREAQAELAHHLELATAARVRAGLPEAGAATGADQWATAAGARAVRRTPGFWLETVLKDVAYAGRMCKPLRDLDAHGRPGRQRQPRRCSRS
jgi:hypothetical protein